VVYTAVRLISTANKVDRTVDRTATVAKQTAEKLDSVNVDSALGNLATATAEVADKIDRFKERFHAARDSLKKERQR